MNPSSFYLYNISFQFPNYLPSLYYMRVSWFISWLAYNNIEIFWREKKVWRRAWDKSLFCYEYKTQKILENVQMKVWLTPSMSPLLCYDVRALCLWENDCWVDFFQILYCCCAYSFLLPLFCSERRIKKNYTLKTGIMMSSIHWGYKKTK